MLHAILLLQLAAPPPQARNAELLVRSSIADYDLGYFEKALAEAEQAYRLYPLAQILFNVGQCHRALKHWEKAAYFYRRYLAKTPNASDRPKVEGLLADVELHAKAEQNPAAAPVPSAVVVVSTTPPAPVARAPPSKADSVPAAAVAPSVQPPAEPSRSHAATYALGATAVASLVVMVVGIVYVENFQSLVGQVGSSTPPNYATWVADQANAQSELPHAQAWEWVAAITGTVAVATGTAAVFTW